LYKAIFGPSRLDLSSTTELIIVPDNVLWYLPFEVLLPESGDRPQVLAGRMPVRYGPTASLVVGNDQPLRRPLRTGIVGSELNKETEVTAGDDLLAVLEKLVPGPLRLAVPLAEPGYLVAPLLDGLIVLDDVGIDRAAGAGWSPFPRSSGGGTDTLEAWMALPYGGPERFVMTSFTTEAEQGLRTTRRAGAGAPGSEVFQTLCRLMANGARTILLTRWRTNGRTNFDLVREFVQELPHEPAAEAWRRSVVLARESPLDINREPRLKRSDDKSDLPTADHPFFWAGYILVDTGTRPGQDDVPGAPAASGSTKASTMPAPPLPAPGTTTPPAGALPDAGKDKIEKSADSAPMNAAKTSGQQSSK
jgi:hypothetical protein